MVAYVDNMLFKSSIQYTVDFVKEQLGGTFVLKALGHASEFSGISIHSNNCRPATWVHQSHGIP